MNLTMEEMMTVKQLDEACKKHRYILARFPSGHIMGINSGMAKIARRRELFKDDQETEFISFLPCDFNTYLTYKHPFT